MSNPRNHGTLIGRLARAPRYFENSDGSWGVGITLAVDNNFRSGPDKEFQTQFPPLRAYLSRNAQTNPWGQLQVGSLIAVDFRVEAGEHTRHRAILQVVGLPQFLESADTTQLHARIAQLQTQANQGQSVNAEQELANSYT